MLSLRQRFSVYVGIAALLHCSSPTIADVIETNDGSRLNGTIVAGSATSVTIKTPFGATVEIPATAIKTMTTDNTVHLAMKSGNVLVGQVSAPGGRVQIDTEDGVMQVKDGTIVTAWPSDQRNPLLPPPVAPRKFKYEAGLDLTGKTGNSQKFYLGGSFKATIAGKHDKLQFYGRGGRSKENGQITVKELIGGVDYEANFSTHSSWYTRMEMEYDAVEDLQLRTTAAAGYGHYFINEEKDQLRGRLGVQFRHESFNSGNSESSPGLDIGLYHMTHFSDWGKLVTDVSYTPSFEDFDDYRVYHETALDVPLGRSNLWSLRLGVGNEYNSRVATGRKHLDTSYFARLMMKWQ